MIEASRTPRRSAARSTATRCFGVSASGSPGRSTRGALDLDPQLRPVLVEQGDRGEGLIDRRGAVAPAQQVPTPHRGAGRRDVPAGRRDRGGRAGRRLVAVAGVSPAVAGVRAPPRRSRPAGGRVWPVGGRRERSGAAAAGAVRRAGPHRVGGPHLPHTAGPAGGRRRGAGNRRRPAVRPRRADHCPGRVPASRTRPGPQRHGRRCHHDCGGAGRAAGAGRRGDADRATAGA